MMPHGDSSSFARGDIFGREQAGAPVAPNLVARGPQVNHLHVPPQYYGVVTDVEGTPEGPWYIKFDCIPTGWMHQIWWELQQGWFDFAEMPEAGPVARQTGEAILTGFLAGRTFEQALAGSDAQARWRLGAVWSWYTTRCAGSESGDLNVPNSSLYEIQYRKPSPDFPSGPELLGVWLRLALAPPQDDALWDSGNGWWVDLEDPSLTPVAMEMLNYEQVPEPWQAILKALNYPGAEGSEVEIEVVEAEADADMAPELPAVDVPPLPDDVGEDAPDPEDL